VLDDPALVELLHAWGLVIIAPLSIIEGPVVSMLTGYLARLGAFDLLPLLAVLVLGDLVGDIALYLIGRKGRLVVRRRWLGRLRISPAQLARLVRRFRAQDVRLILFGKFTHCLGFGILLAAGVARMPHRRSGRWRRGRRFSGSCGEETDERSGPFPRTASRRRSRPSRTRHRGTGRTSSSRNVVSPDGHWFRSEGENLRADRIALSRRESGRASVLPRRPSEAR
jgi:membrane protein YqaA with SNARE-associated domain